MVFFIIGSAKTRGRLFRGSLYVLVSSLLFLSILTILFYNFSKGIRTLQAIYSLVTFEYKNRFIKVIHVDEGEFNGIGSPFYNFICEAK